MATTPRKRPARRTSKPDASGVPMLDMGDGVMQPDVAAIKAAGNLKWHEVPSAIKKLVPSFDLDEPNARRLSWRQEIIKDPSLKFKATPASVAKAHQDKMRWDRISIRTEVGIAALKKMFEEHEGYSADSHYVGKGRKFEAMNSGKLPIGYRKTHVLDPKLKVWVPKDEAEAAKPKRAPRKAGTKRTTTRRTRKPAPADAS